MQIAYVFNICIHDSTGCTYNKISWIELTFVFAHTACFIIEPYLIVLLQPRVDQAYAIYLFSSTTPQLG